MYILGQATYYNWMFPFAYYKEEARNREISRSIIKETYFKEICFFISTGKITGLPGQGFGYDTMVFDGVFCTAEFSSKFEWTSLLLHTRLIRKIKRAMAMPFGCLPLHVNDEDEVIRAVCLKRLDLGT